MPEDFQPHIHNLALDPDSVTSQATSMEHIFPCWHPWPFPKHCISSCMQNRRGTSLKIHRNPSADGMLRNSSNNSGSASSVSHSAVNHTEQGAGHYEHLHFPHIFYPDEVQCQPPASRTVNIHHRGFLPQHHKTNKKRFRDMLIPVPGKRLYFKTKCWFGALCILKDEDRQKLSLLGGLYLENLLTTFESLLKKS